MNPDDFKEAWQSQNGPTLDADQLLKELQGKEQQFATMIFWRDVREVGTGLVMVPVWLFLGIKNSLPWTWYLMVPGLVWVAGFMIWDRRRHGRPPDEPGEPLRRRVEGSMAQIEHQIRLLRQVWWWALVPIALPMLAFFGQGAWQERAGGWWTVLAFSMVLAFGLGVLGFVYWINQYAVRADLEPRRQELEKLLLSLEDEPTGAN